MAALLTDSPKEKIRMNRPLRQLYDATEEDMKFGIGVINLGTGPPAAIISIEYDNWSRLNLELVREAFKPGIILVSAQRTPSLQVAYVATRERLSIQHTLGEHKSLLRAPAWDARLLDIDNAAFGVFDIHRQRRGGFLLLLATREWEFLTAVDEVKNQAIVGGILPRTTEVPPWAANGTGRKTQP
jgi:hypothetical protein